MAEECETANTFHLMMTQINTLGINCGLFKNVTRNAHNAIKTQLYTFRGNWYSKFLHKLFANNGLFLDPNSLLNLIEPPPWGEVLEFFSWLQTWIDYAITCSISCHGFPCFSGFFNLTFFTTHQSCVFKKSSGISVAYVHRNPQRWIRVEPILRSHIRNRSVYSNTV